LKRWTQTNRPRVWLTKAASRNAAGEPIRLPPVPSGFGSEPFSADISMHRRPKQTPRTGVGLGRTSGSPSKVDNSSSSRWTRECYRVAAERFGWSRRTPEPRSMCDGRWLIGWGMATATYPMNYAPGSAMARLLPDGTAEVMSRPRRTIRPRWPKGVRPPVRASTGGLASENSGPVSFSSPGARAG
jgi:hypothetical protein